MRAVLVNLDTPVEQEPVDVNEREDQEQEQDESNPFAEQSSTSRQIVPDIQAPLGLTMLAPLFFAHELNPVNEKAQGLVAVPDGLDLDSWVSPGSIPPAPVAYGNEQVQVDEFGRPRGGFSSMDFETEVNAYGKKSKKSKKDKDVLEESSSKKVGSLDKQDRHL